VDSNNVDPSLYNESFTIPPDEYEKEPYNNPSELDLVDDNADLGDGPFLVSVEDIFWNCDTTPYTNYQIEIDEYIYASENFEELDCENIKRRSRKLYSYSKRHGTQSQLLITQSFLGYKYLCDGKLDKAREIFEKNYIKATLIKEIGAIAKANWDMAVLEGKFSNESLREDYLHNAGLGYLECGNEYLAIKIFKILGKYYFDKGRMEECVKSQKQIVESSLNIGDTLTAVEYLGYLCYNHYLIDGNVYNSRLFFEEAVHYGKSRLLNSKDSIETNSLSLSLAKAYHQITFLLLKKVDESTDRVILEYFEKYSNDAISFYRDCGNKYYEQMMLMNFAIFYDNRNMPRKSLKYSLLSLAKYFELNESDQNRISNELGEIYSRVGGNYKKESEFEKAIIYYYKAYVSSANLTDSLYHLYEISSISTEEVNHIDLDSALHYTYELFQLAKQSNEVFFINESVKLISQRYFYQGLDDSVRTILNWKYPKEVIEFEYLFQKADYLDDLVDHEESTLKALKIYEELLKKASDETLEEPLNSYFKEKKIFILGKVRDMNQTVAGSKRFETILAHLQHAKLVDDTLEIILGLEFVIKYYQNRSQDSVLLYYRELCNYASSFDHEKRCLRDWICGNIEMALDTSIKNTLNDEQLFTNYLAGIESLEGCRLNKEEFNLFFQNLEVTIESVTYEEGLELIDKFLELSFIRNDPYRREPFEEKKKEIIDMMSMEGMTWHVADSIRNGIRLDILQTSIELRDTCAIIDHSSMMGYDFAHIFGGYGNSLDIYRYEALKHLQRAIDLSEPKWEGCGYDVHDLNLFKILAYINLGQIDNAILLLKTIEPFVFDEAETMRSKDESEVSEIVYLIAKKLVERGEVQRSLPLWNKLLKFDVYNGVSIHANESYYLLLTKKCNFLCKKDLLNWFTKLVC